MIITVGWEDVKSLLKGCIDLYTEKYRSICHVGNTREHLRSRLLWPSFVSNDNSVGVVHSH